MNKAIRNLLLISILIGFMTSCWEDTTFRDTLYPDQLIYMPAAYNKQQFVINDINRIRGVHPTEGNPIKYVVDVAKNEFRVPLSAYRSGINNDGAFVVDIKPNIAIIDSINESRQDPYELIPTDKYSLVSSVEMKDGEELAKFDLIVDLKFLLDNFPDKIFAMGVEISSDQRETNPKLSTTAVIIYTRIVKPTANFTYSINSSQAHQVNFSNSSLMSTAYVWDFGDGTAVTDETSPAHTYSSAGTYTVTLTAVGITGEQDKSIKTIEVIVP